MAHDGQDMTMHSVILNNLTGLTGAALATLDRLLEQAPAAVRAPVSEGDRVSAKRIEAHQTDANGLARRAT